MNHNIEQTKKIDIHNLNVLALAYLGDAVYEIYIRKYLLKQGIVKVKDLQQNATEYVSAKKQSQFLNEMIESSFLHEDEIAIMKRARNHKSHQAPKGTDIINYKKSTGLEAIIGFLYLEKKENRINEIMKHIVGD